MKEITATELKNLNDRGEDFELIDVREPGEYEFANLSGKLIPMGSVPNRVDEIPKGKKVVVMCRSGKRSGDIISFLETTHGYDNLYNLKGGILAYSDEVDPSIPKY
jgi:adenylyltransferase/sulfurtransferase